MEKSAIEFQHNRTTPPADTKTAARAISEYVATGTSMPLPAAVVEEAKRCVIDWVGVTVAGSRDRLVASARELVANGCPDGEATLIGSDLKARADEAAFINGLSGHILNFDDMSPVFIGHNSAVLLPVALAVGERLDASGASVLDAFVVGWEVCCALGWGTIAVHYQAGWHASGTIGAIGSAAAAARLLGLSAEETTDALGIAASAAAGLRVNLGTSANVFHIGHAAEQGVRAALLASKGWNSGPTALEGFFAVLARGHDPSEGISRLGREWSILDPGVSRKSYPTCGAMHPAFDAVLDMVCTGVVAADEIQSVECRAPPTVAALLTLEEPKTIIDARYCLPFGIAVAALRGRVGLDEYSEEMLRDSAVRSFMGRISLVVDPELAGSDLSSDFTTEVAVSLRDGRTVERHVSAPAGPMVRPLSDGEIEAKFRVCLERAEKGARADVLLDALHTIEEAASIRNVAVMLGT